MGPIEPDVVAEGKRILARASADGTPIRLLGGVAIGLRAPGELAPAFRRTYADLDFMTAKKAVGVATDLFRSEGYEPHVAFNALHGGDRLLFFDNENERQVDVFVGAFSMCHRVPLDGRLEVDPVSIPLAELLLTKLQVVQLNEKDVRDALALLHDHPVGEEDGETVNAPRVAALCASDWGLWRTITQNLVACRGFADTYDVPDRPTLDQRLDALLDRIEAEPKSRAWKLRARIGDRKRWYELPEEV
ncbi:MAG TPA: hypothetical protein VHQ96_08095 [Gaiellaceae bacterium]|jgi:hypothetical protein|nr:hypothetical protein [Gaiellaceae bacterium]